MKTFYIWISVVMTGFAANSLFACTIPASLCEYKSEVSFPLIENSRPAQIIVEKTNDVAVLRVAKSFAEDLKQVSGRAAVVSHDKKRIKKSAIIIGVVGQSPLIDELIDQGKLDVTELKDQWEAFKIVVVKNPWPKVEQVLLIVGSDRRGAIFGAYDISEKIGVSPWYWFADVPIQKKDNIYITAGSRSDKPGVRYRGIFINDEDPALSGWAKKKFGGVNSKMYEHVFELMLRLKANYIWPAMWAPKAFHLDDPKNTELADAMGIVVGASHHEPMTRAQNEWHRLPAETGAGGEWNYLHNRDNLRKFWRGGIERMMSKGDGKVYESLITMGMRGDGDEPMSQGTAIDLLEKIVADQRQIIQDVTKKPAEQTPQLWALYKEVQDYYDQGMSVPDDVTLLFADDNWGQIRRLPTKNLNRKGGFGVYYHFDYVGAPRNYKWLNTIQIEKVWQQMNLAYERGAKNIWIVNVGDIKPAEYPLDFFMKMAWAPEAMTPDALAAFPQDWAERQFGAEHADGIGMLITEYTQYASRRKPELINENTFAVGTVTKEALITGEFDDLMNQWRELMSSATEMKKNLTPQQHDAYFQLIEYPVLALGNLHELYWATAWNRQLARTHDARANYFLKIAEESFARDSVLTEKYHSINNSKWNGMMNQVHMNYVIWNTPTQQSIPSLVKVAADRPVHELNPIPLIKSRELKNSNSIKLNAADFNRKHNNAGLSWTAIPNLGQSKAAMIVLPQGRPATRIEDGVNLEYDFSINSASDLQVILHLSPTLDTIGSEGIRLGVSIDDGKAAIINYHLIPTSGAIKIPQQQAWTDAVINNGHQEEVTFAKISAGKHSLKIWRMDDNIILEKIEINPKI
ncbi:MAG: glycosyl hydrolase 115 family protein [Cellvibrio sp.]|nr:glycosyl hydrolase 115 family protein [Cellvibrio sp.]